MKIHCLLHVDFETPGYIVDWAEWNDFEVSYTHIYNNDPFPELDDFDMLVVMGGPMGVYEYEKYSWLKDEQDFIKKAIDADKYVLGICLGSQLIAAALGAKVYPSGKQEIGWFKIDLTEEGNQRWGSFDPENRWVVLHWHGDTFDLPEGAKLLASSEATKHQAYAIGDKVLALQFHLEATPVTAGGMINIFKDELDALEDQKYVMPGKEILKRELFFHDTNTLLEAILDQFVNNN